MAAEELTYDPVVGGQSRARVRPLGPPPPGCVLVLVPGRGPALTVRAGERVPDVRPAAYRSTVLVDITEHRLVLPLQLPCAEPGFTFRCRVTVSCRIADQVAVVARGVRDMGSTVYGPVRELLTTCASLYAPGRAHDAQAALNSALTGFTCGPPWSGRPERGRGGHGRDGHSRTGRSPRRWRTGRGGPAGRRQRRVRWRGRRQWRRGRKG